MNRRAWASWLLVGLVGCESVDDVVKQHRPAVEQTFSRLRALAPKVEAAPGLEALVPGALPVPLKLDGEGFNAQFVYAEDLPDPGAAAPVALRTLDSLPLLQCGALLRTGHFFNDTVTRVSPSVAAGTLEACARLRYALVIKVRQYLRPELSLETRQFAPGRYRAEVLVFDLSTGAALGGFPVFSTNNSRVNLADGDPNHLDRVIANLDSQTFEALREGAAKYLSAAPR